MTNEEQTRIIIEKIAAGLRRMGKPPDYFVFIGTEEDWDRSVVCGISVIYCPYQFLMFRPYSDEDCPFIPCWKNTEQKNEYDVYKFGKGYYEGGNL